jgi:hypothetical protein
MGRLAPNKIIYKDKRIGCGALDIDIDNKATTEASLDAVNTKEA